MERIKRINRSDDINALTAANFPFLKHAYTIASFPGSGANHTGVVNDLIGNAHINAGSTWATDYQAGIKGFSPPVGAVLAHNYTTQNPWAIIATQKVKVVIVVGYYSSGFFTIVPALALGYGGAGDGITLDPDTVTAGKSDATHGGSSVNAVVTPGANATHNVHAIVIPAFGASVNVAATYYSCNASTTGVQVATTGAANLDWISPWNISQNISFASTGSGSHKYKGVYIGEFAKNNGISNAGFWANVLRWMVNNPTSGLPPILKGIT